MTYVRIHLRNGALSLRRPLGTGGVGLGSMIGAADSTDLSNFQVRGFLE